MVKKLLRKIGVEDDSHEFRPLLSEIEERPVNPLGRLLFWIVVFLVVFLVVWTFFGKVDIVVSARGMVAPEGEVKIIQALNTGVVQKILVKEGSKVEVGQVLMEIDPSTTEPELGSLVSTLDSIKLEIQMLEALSEGKLLELEQIDSETAIQNKTFLATSKSYQTELEAKRLELNKIEEELKILLTQKHYQRKELLTNRNKVKRLKKVLDIIPRDEYNDTVKAINQNKAQIKAIKYQLLELGHQRAQVQEELSHIKESFSTDILTLLIQKKLEAKQSQARIEGMSFHNKKQKIKSPVAGYVVGLGAHTIGGVVTPAQKLISIVPLDTKLIVKANIQNRDIGYIKEGMPVSLKIDTYNFQRFGTLAGTIQHIAKNSIEHEKLGTVYEIFVSPLGSELVVEGQKRTISPGMTLTAEVKVGKRRILEFFVYPLIKYWDEGMSVR